MFESARAPTARADAHVHAGDDYALTGLVARKEAEQTPQIHGWIIGGPADAVESRIGMRKVRP
jgi:hypothetical protein